MNYQLCYLILLISFSLTGTAQQKPDKKLSFCGWRYFDTTVIRNQFEKKLSFLNIHDGDTIVDIGSSSGSFEGCLCVIGNFKNVNFVLVDIDSLCLNKKRVDNMVAYYSQVKTEEIKQNFTIVQNTVDSLYLPENSYKKAWLFNTLHEIPDKQKMVKDIYKILQTGGELVLLELLSRPKHTIHGGCHQPLMNENEIKTLFEQNGFRQADTLLNSNQPKKIINPEYLVRFIKN